MWSYIKITVLLCFLSIVFADEQNYEGNTCTVKQSGEAGECKDFANCAAAVRLAGDGVYPQVCSCEDETVCCGPTSCPPLKPGTVNIEETGYRAWDYCISLADRVFPCKETENGWTRLDNCPRIPDKDQTDAVLVPGEYPHLARLAYGDLNDKPNWYCIGSLISEEWILSESWCITFFPDPDFAVVGGWPEGGPIFSDTNTYPILRTILHPDYDNSTSYSSTIALLQLTRRVVLSKFVLPACLHTGIPLSDEGLIMTDWYWTDLYLTAYQKYPMTRVSHEECLQDNPNGLKESTYICAKVTSNKGSGWVTSGSALQQYSSDRVACTYLLSGVYAFTSAKSKTRVFTRVAPHVAWIESYVWPRIRTEL